MSVYEETAWMLPANVHGEGVDALLKWLVKIIEQRVESYFDNKHVDFDCATLPDTPSASGIAQVISENALNGRECLIMALAVARIFAPEILDIFLSKNATYDQRYTEFGGLTNSDTSGFVPTLQTALFLLAGDDRRTRFAVLQFVLSQSILFKKRLLKPVNQTSLTAIELVLEHYWFFRIVGQEAGNEFEQLAASRLETDYSWEDLVLSSVTREHLIELELWLSHREVLLEKWGMRRQCGDGYKALFYGPPGTGKTLTASLLAKKTGQSVYRIDLSRLVSKYIGETSKNLDDVFQIAEQRRWILFFDEADSIFGKRTEISSSNDRHANQESAHLLQRIEATSCMVVLATNLKNNIDEAFIRRFHSLVYFPVPGEQERLRLWENGFSALACTKDIHFSTLSQEYNLSGAEINNVIRYVSLNAIAQETFTIRMDDVVSAIQREKIKSGQFC